MAARQQALVIMGTGIELAIIRFTFLFIVMQNGKHCPALTLTDTR